MEELGIKQSDKAEANKPFDQKFQALCAMFDLRSPHPMMLPKQTTTKTFESLFKALETNREKLVGIRQMQEFCGLLEL